MNWGDVRQRLETRFGVPFEYLCVRLPQGTGMGIFITSECGTRDAEGTQFVFLKLWLFGDCCEVHHAGMGACATCLEQCCLYCVVVRTVCSNKTADMVSGWKSEREQVQAGIKRLSMQYQKVASKCGDELREVRVGWDLCAPCLGLRCMFSHRWRCWAALEMTNWAAGTQYQVLNCSTHVCARTSASHSQTTFVSIDALLPTQVARALVLQHARTLNAAVVDRTAAIQAVANRAVEVFFKDVSAGDMLRG